MRTRAYLTGLLIAVLTLGVVGLAGADESVQTEDAKIKPGKLPKKGKANVKLINTIKTFNEPGTNQPKSARRTILDLPKQMKVNVKSVPFCKTDIAGLERAATAADAKRACGKKSQVSIDRGSDAVVTVGSPTGPATIIDVDVVAFNEKGKRLLLYSKPTGLASGIPASILVGKLKNFSKVKGRPPGTKVGKPYRKSLDVQIPPLAAGAISNFKVTVKKGKYLQAGCKPKRMKFQATTFFTDGTSTADTDVHKCKPKRK